MKETTFKELAIALLSLSLVFIFGCSDTNPINQPDDLINSSVTSSVTAEPNWITMPKFISKGLTKGGTGFSVSKLVKVDKNTDIKIKDDYVGPNGKKVKIDIKIRFKKNTVKVDTDITMTFNIETGVIEFWPHMIFNKEAELEATIGGLEGIEDDADLNFYYLNPEGAYDKMEKHKLKLKVKKGEIKMQKAKIPHFSRYGFVH